ncbi:ABC transporter ATP-binding protein [Dehalobacterium formicoaceticum]|uniref:ABC transporter ATP-binding protein n=1 Tax=Dehalobacterium formicoaceticum TaxID=51515 RepID=A0ABT1Y0F8_9FIRM|nr:ABC transporter ATP-binding protein [Dehalobacterium formicoaceticum]MCR6544354.1 ABC transporter ATP-binding protein [Dehalobacterium formicoaceticum]
MITIENLYFKYDKNPIFTDLSLSLKDKVNIIVGPNAAGKSTLLKCIFGLLPAKGEILWDDKRLSEIPRKEKMNLMVYLPQQDMAETTLTVFETVLLGRLESLAWKVGDDDLEKALTALEALNIDSIARRKMNQLSGGQRKLVSIAQTLVRDPKMILMDEPTNSLDMQKQLELFSIIEEVSIKKDMMFIIVMHDINLSSRYADSLVVLKSGGEFYSQGNPKEIVTEEMLKEVYGIEAYVMLNENDIPVVSPIRSVKDTIAQ